MKFTEFLFGGEPITTDEWREQHREHLDAGDSFGRQAFGLPGRLWYWLTCPCSSRHLCDASDDTTDEVLH